jgi:hypothetical protein
MCVFSANETLVSRMPNEPQVEGSENENYADIRG